MSGITVVIPHYNRRALLLRVLETLHRQTAEINQVLIVDNGSQDNSVEAARQLGAQVITLERNYGFAYAVNRGIAAATSEWVAIVNNDVLLSADYLQKLLSTAHQANAQFATGLLLQENDPERIDGTYDLVAHSLCAWRAGNGLPLTAAWRQQRTIHSAPMTAALFQRSLFQQIGGLEERLGSYLEDVEFGLRCKRNSIAGVYVPQAVGWHQGSATRGAWHSQTVRQLARNQLLLAALHYDGPLLRRSCWKLLVGQLLWGGVAIRHNAGRAWLLGKWEGIQQFQRLRRENVSRQENGTALAASILEDERKIRALQRETGSTLYWRLYFWLT